MRILLICFLLMPFVVNAEVYLVVDTTTNEIMSLSPIDDAQLEPGWEKIILPGRLVDYPLQYHSQYYKYTDRFIVNVQKLSDEALAIQEQEEKEEELALVKEKLQDIAIDALRGEGKNFKHLKKKGE